MEHDADIIRSIEGRIVASHFQNLTLIINELKTDFYKSSQDTALFGEHPDSFSLAEQIRAIRDCLGCRQEAATGKAAESRGDQSSVGRQIKTASTSLYVKGYYRKNGKFVRPHLRAKAHKQ